MGNERLRNILKEVLVNDLDSLFQDGLAAVAVRVSGHDPVTGVGRVHDSYLWVDLKRWVPGEGPAPAETLFWGHYETFGMKIAPSGAFFTDFPTLQRVDNPLVLTRTIVGESDDGLDYRVELGKFGI